MNSSAKNEYQGELTDDQAVKQHGGAQLIPGDLKKQPQGTLAVGDIVGNESGQPQADSHPIVDAANKFVDPHLNLSLSEGY